MVASESLKFQNFVILLKTKYQMPKLSWVFFQSLLGPQGPNLEFVVQGKLALNSKTGENRIKIPQQIKIYWGCTLLFSYPVEQMRSLQIKRRYNTKSFLSAHINQNIIVTSNRTTPTPPVSGGENYKQALWVPGLAASGASCQSRWGRQFVYPWCGSRPRPRCSLVSF